MKYGEELIKLLKEQKEIFLSIEAVTEEMYAAPVEDLEKKMKKRGDLFKRVQSLQEQIEEICKTDPLIEQAVKLKGIKEDFPEPLRDIYTASYSVRAVTNRLIRNSEFMKERIATEKEILLKKIEGLNQSGSSVAERYRKSVQVAHPQSRPRWGKNV